MRLFYALAMLLLVIALPAYAQNEDSPWQASVTRQIEAFRAGDGAAALELAGAGFKKQFTDPAAFLGAITASGYGPIVQSRSHSFGEFTRSSPTVAMQTVQLVGPDQSLYEAAYQMNDEPGVGWRVAGVVLRKLPGIGI